MPSVYQRPHGGFDDSGVGLQPSENRIKLFFRCRFAVTHRHYEALGRVVTTSANKQTICLNGARDEVVEKLIVSFGEHFIL